MLIERGGEGVCKDFIAYTLPASNSATDNSAIKIISD